MNTTGHLQCFFMIILKVNLLKENMHTLDFRWINLTKREINLH